MIWYISLSSLVTIEIHMANTHDRARAKDTRHDDIGQGRNVTAKGISMSQMENIIPDDTFCHEHHGRDREAPHDEHQKLALRNRLQEADANLSFGNDPGNHRLGN